MSQPKRIVAILFEENADERGNITLKKLTTAQWVTVAYIANAMTVSEQTMYRLIVDGQVMPYHRVGIQIRVDVADFYEYYKKCEHVEYERPGA